jgi:hypothetical protein
MPTPTAQFKSYIYDLASSEAFFDDDNSEIDSTNQTSEMNITQPTFIDQTFLLLLETRAATPLMLILCE